MQPMVSAWTTTARSVFADFPGSSAVSAPRRVSENGTPSSSKMSPISCITPSVRPDGLGVCSSASSVSIIQARSASAIAAVLPTVSPFRLVRNRVQPTGPALIRPARAARSVVEGKICYLCPGQRFDAVTAGSPGWGAGGGCDCDGDAGFACGEEFGHKVGVIEPTVKGVAARL